MKDFFKRYSKVFIWVMSILLVLLLAGIGYYLYQKYSNKDIVAVVGNEKISETDLSRAIYALTLSEENNKNVSSDLRKTVINKLTETSIIRQEAEKRNISVSDQEVLARAKKDNSDYDLRESSQKELMREAAKNNLLKEKLIDKLVTYSDGEFLLVRFDKYLGHNKNESKYLSEKAEAEKFALQLSNDIRSGTIDFAEAEARLIKHPLFGEQAFTNAGFSVLLTGELNKTAYQEGVGLLSDNAFRTIIADVSEGSVSEPKLLKVNDSTNEEVNSVDGIYVIAKVDKKYKGETADFTSWLEDKKAEYSKQKLFGYLLNPQVAYADNNHGSCNGGLVTSGSSNPAGYVIHMRYLDAVGNHYDLSGSTTNVDAYADDGSYSSYSWSGNTKSCGADSLVETSGTDSFPSNHTFTMNSNGNEYLGYDSCGGNGYGLLCSCVSDTNDGYRFDPFVAGTHGLVTAGGHWHQATRWKANGTSDTYTDEGGTSINPFKTRMITNGGTSAVALYYQANRPPVNSYGPSPVSGGTFSQEDTIIFRTYAMDPDGHNVNHHVAYAKSTDGGATYGAWNYLETGYIGQGTTPWIGSPIAATALGEGTFKWVITVNDAYGLYNTVPSGSPNSWSHNNPSYFTIRYNYKITPSADAGCTISPSTEQTVTSGSSSAFSFGRNTGYTLNGYSIDGGAVTAGTSYTFSNVRANHTIRAKCTKDPEGNPNLKINFTAPPDNPIGNVVDGQDIRIGVVAQNTGNTAARVCYIKNPKPSPAVNTEICTPSALVYEASPNYEYYTFPDADLVIGDTIQYRGMARDNEGSSTFTTVETETRLFTIVAVPETPTINCTATPAVVRPTFGVNIKITSTTGDVRAPYSVQAYSDSDNNGTYETSVFSPIINMPGAERYVSFANEGKYEIKVQDSPDEFSLGEQSCGVVTVSSSGEIGGGGEKL